MKILLSPQVRNSNKIWYEVRKDIVIVTMNGITDSFDFSGMPNGELKMFDDNGEELVETKLEENPLRNARRTNGTLYVEFVFSIEPDEKDNRLLFPEWMTVSEFNSLMSELRNRKKQKKEYDIYDRMEQARKDLKK